MPITQELSPGMYAVDTINGYQTQIYGDNIPDIFANLKHHDQPLVIWFHGGLVSRKNGYEAAHVGLYGNKDGIKGFVADNVEAIYYIYESGPMYEGLKAASVLLADDLMQSKLGHLETFLRPIVNGAVENIVTKVHEGISGFIRRLRGDDVIKTRLQGMAGGQGSAFAFFALSNPTKVSEDDLLRAHVHSDILSKLTPADASRNSFGFALNIDFASLLIEFGYRAVQVAIRVAKRIKAGRGHGLQQTIIEEIVREYLTIGPETWNQIKKEVDKSFSDEPRAAGVRLVASLGAYLDQHPNRKVFLIGHSTGAIYVARFVMKAKEHGLNTKFNLRLLAGAARMDLYNELADAAGDCIEETVVYGMGDDPSNPDHNYEHEEYLFAVPPIDKTPIQYLYKGSLLYMVSGALEDGADEPLIGMQRFHMNAPDSNAPPGDPQLRLPVTQVWSDTPSVVGKRATMSHHHGGFGVDPATFGSVLI